MPLSRLKPRSASAVVRNMLDEIEAALHAGASREDVWKTLKTENDLSISFDGFCKALMRARASRRTDSPPPLKTPAPIRQAERAAPPGAEARGMEARQGRDGEAGSTRSATARAEGLAVDCAIQGDEQTPEEAPVEAPRKDKIRSRRDFQKVHDLDFSNLDDKHK